MGQPERSLCLNNGLAARSAAARPLLSMGAGEARAHAQGKRGISGLKKVRADP